MITNDSGKLPLQAYAPEGGRMIACFQEMLGNGAAQTTDDAVFFDGKDRVGFACCGSDCIVIQWFDGVHTEDARGEAMFVLEVIGGLDGVMEEAASGDQG